MFTKIKEFLFGKPAQVETPVKTVELNSVEDGSVKMTLPATQDYAGHTDYPANLSQNKKSPVRGFLLTTYHIIRRQPASILFDLCPNTFTDLFCQCVG